MAKHLTISDNDLKEILHVDKETRSGQYICTCPFCGKEKHFYINKKTQLFDCKKCFVEGSIYKLLKHLDKLYLLGDKSVEITETLKSIRQMIDEDSNTITDVVLLPKVRMPLGFKLALNNRYLISRGITDEDVKRYNIGKTNLVGRFDNYILFPIYDNGEIRGFLGRYGNKKVPENKLRYNNSLGVDFAGLLYGYDEIIKGKTQTVIIVEGVFDKIAVDKKLRLDECDDGIKCVCTFGKKISDIQIQKLIQKEIRNVILSFDYDALKEIRQYGMELSYYFETSVAVCTFKKDIDECSAEEVLQVFNGVKPIREFSTSVIGKLKR